MTGVRSQIRSWNCIPGLFLHLGGSIMTKDEILYTTTEEQVEKLKSQKLVITDEEYAKLSLELFGYSNLIKSYREPYVITSGKKKIFRSGVTFNQICSLYILDKNLRNAVMASMQDLEEHIKEVAADVVAKSFGVYQEDYLRFSNYRDKKKRTYRFTLRGILETMRKTLETDKNPIYHYKTEHGIVPPWVLFKSIYFSTIVNFIDLLKPSQQREMAERLYVCKDLKLSIESCRILMMDTLFICLDYRNIAAHGGRIYNYNNKNEVRAEKIFGSDELTSLQGFSKLLFLLRLFKYQNPYERLKNVLERELNRHCSEYPQDVTYLGKILNMNIISQNIVYVTEKSNKYHANPYCSGIKDSREIQLEEARDMGYQPCKRCAKDIVPIV